MKPSRVVFLLFLLAGFFLLFYRFIPSQSPLDEVEEGTRLRSDESIRLEGLRYKEWKEEALMWVLDARWANFYLTEEETRFHDVDVTFLPSSGGEISLRAQKVFYDLGSRLLKAEGEVSGESDQGFRFHTGRLFYKADQKEVNTPDKVTLQKDRLFIEGIGMEGSLRDQRFVLLSSVRARFSPEEATR